MPVPPEGITRSLAGRNGVAVLPSEAQGTVHFVRAGKYVRVGSERYPRFSADAPGPLETLWLLPPDDVGRLRDLLSQARGPSWYPGGTLHLSDFAMLAGPLLRLGDRTVDLATSRPARIPKPPIASPFRRSRSTVSPAATPGRARSSCSAPLQTARRRRDRSRVPRNAGARITLPAPSEPAHAPTMGSLFDRDFVYDGGWNGLHGASCRIHLQTQIVRESNDYVVLARDAKGMILDDNDVSNEPGHIGALAAVAQHRRRADLPGSGPARPRSFRARPACRVLQ
jgi:hypothetical protein